MFDKQTLSAYLSAWVKKKNLAGVSACIMDRDGLVYAFNEGFRDAALSVPVDTDTMFGIASMSKSITSLCLCILESEGKLHLEDPVSRYIPEFRVPGQPR